MKNSIIKIQWEGPLSVEQVIKKMKDGGKESNNWSGRDYGLYQIYGWHPLHDDNTLLYVGKAQEQTFSERLKQHQGEWIKDEKHSENMKVYVGRLEDDDRYLDDNSWRLWNMDVNIAEAILIYKYSPHYNSSGLWEYPMLTPYNKITLIHMGNRNKLKEQDEAPSDYMKRKS